MALPQGKCNQMPKPITWAYLISYSDYLSANGYVQNDLKTPKGGSFGVYGEKEGS